MQMNKLKFTSSSLRIRFGAPTRAVKSARLSVSNISRLFVYLMKFFVELPRFAWSSKVKILVASLRRDKVFYFSKKIPRRAIYETERCGSSQMSFE